MVQRSTAADVSEIFARRVEPLEDVARNADAVARACHAMAVRFHRGGKLLAFGISSASTDAQHVSVEFVHPVIVGKRALPAISLTADVATVSGVAGGLHPDDIFACQLRTLAGPDDIALGISSDGNCAGVVRGLDQAHRLGLLTVALLGGDGGAIAADPEMDHVLLAAASDPRVIKEVHVTTYHLLWELVHVFFEQPGVLAPSVIA